VKKDLAVKEGNIMQGQLVRDLMTPDPVCLPESATLREAAEQMRANDIGDVIITRGRELTGIMTDRDIVVRGIATGLDPQEATIAEVATSRVLSVRADQPVMDAVDLMREHALRRLPVCDDKQEVIGVVSLGDLATERDPASVLSGISAAPPNN
jgi:CBS domain-containing protein